SLAVGFGIAARILPVRDDVVQTIVDTNAGRLEFQQYFVARRCEPVVTKISFAGAQEAKLSPHVANAFDDENLGTIIICPSNPYLSVDPILAIPEFRRRLRERRVPGAAVSPTMGEKEIKGPTAKLMQELGVPNTSRSIADHYEGLIDGIIVDAADAGEATAVGIPVLATPTLMVDRQSKEAL